jgi:nucleoside 2-deoxyribosyltransferase
MESVRIYLSGGMSGLSFEEQAKWRTQIRDAIKYGDYDLKKAPMFFDPTQYYSVFEKEHKTEREAMEFDLYNLRKSDLVVVNFNNPKSLGTAMELMLADELRIPVIGINKDKVELHPWLECCTTRMCDSLKEAVEHIARYYLM